MSHLLQVWDTPRPTTLAEALAIRNRRVREGAAFSPRCRELAALLTARRPDIDADDDDDAGVWTDGPLARNAEAPVFGIGVRQAAVDAVVPFVIDQALKLGLVVLDEESGRLHLPGGAAAPAPAPAAAEGPRSAPRRSP